jgi:hypothetical protein
MPVWLDWTLMLMVVAGGVALLVRSVVAHSRCEACPANPAFLGPKGNGQRKTVQSLRLGRTR